MIKKILLALMCVVFVGGCKCGSASKNSVVTYYPKNSEPIVYRGFETYRVRSEFIIMKWKSGKKVRLAGDYTIEERN